MTASSPDTPDSTADLEALIQETLLLFHRLRRAAQEVHGQGETSAGRRGLLRSLWRGAPRSVPQLARERPVSRQHVQALVNSMLADGLVALGPNPAHRRSPLVELTPKGRRLIEVMDAREKRLLAGLELARGAAELRGAAEVLRDVRRAFEGARARARRKP